MSLDVGPGRDLSLLIGQTPDYETGRIHLFAQSLFLRDSPSGALAFGGFAEFGAIVFYTSISMVPSLANIS